MNKENINKVRETISGYYVKNLRYLKLDNIISGHVKCPIFGKERLHDGFISIQWNSNGYPINKHKGMPDYKLNLESPK